MDGRLSMKTAVIFILCVWLWALPFSLMPTLEVWNKFIPEGYLTTCSFDYLTPGQDSKMFMLAIFTWAYVIPVCLLVLFYSKILGHVREHEKAMKEQAKKMGVKSLSAGDEEKSAEVKIAKVAVTIFFLFLCAWTPYAVVCLVGVFHSNRYDIDHPLLLVSLSKIGVRFPQGCADTHRVYASRCLLQDDRLHRPLGLCHQPP